MAHEKDPLEAHKLTVHSKGCPAYARMDSPDYDPEDCDVERCAVAKSTLAAPHGAAAAQLVGLPPSPVGLSRSSRSWIGRLA